MKNQVAVPESAKIQADVKYQQRMVTIENRIFDIFCEEDLKIYDINQLLRKITERLNGEMALVKFNSIQELIKK